MNGFVYNIILSMLIMTKNIAICLSGQYRTFDYCSKNFLRMIKTFKKNVSTILEEDVNIVIFFATWDNQDINERKIKSIVGNEFECYVRLEDYEFAHLIYQMALYRAGQTPSSLEQITEAWYLKYSVGLLKREYEETHDIIFDLVFDTRPDLFYMQSDLKCENIIWQKQLKHLFSLQQYELLIRGGFRNNFFEDFNRHTFIDDLYFLSNSHTHDVLTAAVFKMIRDGRVIGHQTLAMHLISNSVQLTSNDLFSCLFRNATILRPKIADKYKYDISRYSEADIFIELIQSEKTHEPTYSDPNGRIRKQIFRTGV